MPTEGGKRLHFVSTMDNAPLKRGAAESKGIIGGLGSFVKHAKVFAPLAVGALFAKLGKDVHKFSQQFQIAMKEVQTISAETQRDFKGVSDAVIEMSRKAPDDAIELSKALYQIVSAGYDGAEGMKVLDSSVKAAVGGITETKVAADALTTVMNAWGKTTDDLNNISDVFFQTVKLGKTTFEELSRSIALVAPMAAAMGVSFEEVTAATATLTKQGVRTNMAITQIRSAMQKLGEVLGDTWSQTMTFQEALQKVVDMAGGSQTELQTMLGSIEAVQGALGLTGKNAKTAGTDLKSMYKDAEDAARKAYEVMLEADVNQWKMAWNNIKAEFVNFGNSIVMGTSNIAKAINSAFEIDAAGQLKDETIAVNKLFAELSDVNTEEERRKEIFDQLKEVFPDIKTDLEDEEQLMSDLVDRVREYNQEQINRIVIAERQAEIDELVEKRNEQQIKNTNKQVELLEMVSKNLFAIEQNEVLSKKYPELQTELINALTMQGTAVEKLQAFKDILEPVQYQKDLVASLADTFDFGIHEMNQLISGKEKVIELDEEINDATTKREEIEKRLLGHTLEGEKARQRQIDKLNKEIKAGQDDSGSGIAKSINKIKELDDEISALEDKLETADFEQEIAIRLEIQNLEGLKEDYNQKIQDALDHIYRESTNQYMLDAGTMESMGDPVLKFKNRAGEYITVAKDINSEIKKGLKPMERLTDEEKERLKYVERIAEIYQKTGVDVGKMSQGLSDMSEILGSLSYAFGQIDSDFGRSLGRMADVTFNASNFLDKLPTENFAAIASSGIGMVGSIIGMFQDIASVDRANQMEAITDAYEQQNKAIEKQIELMKELYGGELTTAEQEAISGYEEIMRVQQELAKQEKATLEGRVKQWFGLFHTWEPIAVVDPKNIEELRELLTDPWTLEQMALGEVRIEDYDELMAIIDRYDEAQKAIEGLREQAMAQRLGFDKGSISDSILQGVQEGLQLSGNELGQWSDNFGELVRSALTQNILAALNDRFLTNFMEEFNKAMEDGSLSDTERDALTRLYVSAVQGAEEMWDEIQPVLNDYANRDKDQEGLSGAIRGITEETASLIAGQFYAMRQELITMNERNSPIPELAEDALIELVAIRDNTGKSSVSLESIQADMEEMKDHIIKSL